MLNTLTETLKIFSMRPEPHNFPLGWFRLGKVLWNRKSGLGMINIALTCKWFRKTTEKYLFCVIMYFFPLDLKAINDSLGSTDLVPAPTVHGPYEGNSIFSFLGAIAREGICSANPLQNHKRIWDLRAEEIFSSLLCLSELARQMYSICYPICLSSHQRFATTSTNAWL